MKGLIPVVIFMLVISPPLAFGQQWTVDKDKSTLNFAIKNAGLKATGSFQKYSFNIHFDPNNLASSKIVGEVLTESIATGIALRDKHLKKEDYFDVVKFPVMKFVSYKILATGKTGDYELHGSLVIKNTSKDIVIPFHYLNNGNIGIYSGRFSLNRIDFGVGSKSWTMSDIAEINFKINAHNTSE
jgi:polyisoprenoid-binding protein YceI